MSTTALHSRPMKTWLFLGLPLALMALLLAFPPIGLDFALSNYFYTPGEGFSGKHSFFLEDILHDRAKQAIIILAVVAFVGLIISLFYRPWAWLRLPLGYIVLSVGISTAIVTPLKVVTGVHCPWDLTEFGGKETYTPLLSARAPTANPGKCWPAGHASSGFIFFALYFVFRDRRPRLAKAALVFAFTLGAIFSIGRIMQGAHFLSHTLWTALFDWMIALGFYHLFLYRPQGRRLDVAAAVPVSSGSQIG